MCKTDNVNTIDFGSQAKNKSFSINDHSSTFDNLSIMIQNTQTNYVRFSIVLFVVFIQEIVVAGSSDYECGINRFNNESPLTERIVGGNNSLQ